jgi:sugar/nucleoside kinase (ribokinase family)
MRTRDFVSIVGTVNHDVIIAPDGARHESLGGILYNVLSLAAVLEGTGIRVRPHGRLGSAHRSEAVELISAFPDVETDALIPDPGGTNLSVLDYSGPGDRREEVEMRVAPLTPADLSGAAEGRAVLVNMISGRDLERATLTALRRSSSALFLLDIQALARTLGSPRRPRGVPDAPEWTALFDVVRGNEEEVEHFGGRPGDVSAAAARLLTAGAREVLVTRGEQGAVRYYRGGGTVRSEEIPAVPCRDAVDPTGCGDSFLSGVCAGRVLGMTGSEAAHLGAWVASEVCALAGLRALRRLRGVRDRALARHPRLSPPGEPPDSPPGPTSV